MVRFFWFLVRFMRDRGAFLGEGEFNALWVGIIGAYLFITIDVLAGALLITIRRKFRHAAQIETPAYAQPRVRER